MTKDILQKLFYLRKTHLIRMFFLALLFMAFGSANAENLGCSWRTLKSGNNRFVKNSLFARQRAQVANGQNPSYVVISCSDSRVPPELVFNQGIGDLFVSRVAGQVSDNVVIDSIEYAVSHFDVSAIVVLGHTECGAVIGALKHLIKNNGAIDQIQPGHLNAVLIPIEIAILEAGIDIYAPNALDLAIQANIAYVANQLLAQSTVISNAVADGTLCIIGAEYDLQTGVAQELFFIP